MASEEHQVFFQSPAESRKSATCHLSALRYPPPSVSQQTPTQQECLKPLLRWVLTPINLRGPLHIGEVCRHFDGSFKNSVSGMYNAPSTGHADLHSAVQWIAVASGL